MPRRLACGWQGIPTCLVGWLAGWLVAWLAGWLVGCWLCWLGWLVDIVGLYVGCLPGLPVGWLYMPGTADAKAALQIHVNTSCHADTEEDMAASLAWHDWTLSEATGNHAKQPSSQQAKQPTMQPVNQPTSQPTNRPANQLASQAANQVKPEGGGSYRNVDKPELLAAMQNDPQLAATGQGLSSTSELENYIWFQQWGAEEWEPWLFDMAPDSQNCGWSKMKWIMWYLQCRDIERQENKFQDIVGDLNNLEVGTKRRRT
jgi:hypothetical protein